MNKREAKKSACLMAAIELKHSFFVSGETFDPLSDDNVSRNQSDLQKEANAMRELIAELERRGESV